MTAVSQLSIRLIHSPIGTPLRHRLIVRSLGLRRLNHTVVRPATPQIQGMIRKVGYLLEVRPQ